MTILSVLAGWVGLPIDAIRGLIVSGAAASPDLASAGADLLAKLNTTLTEESLAALAGAIPAEALDILRGHLNPKDHPSDII